MRRGFTLVELVVVVAIILILAAILLPIVANRIEDARISRLASEYRTIKTAVTMYYADTGILPDDGLIDLYNDPDNPDGWRGPYIDKRPILSSGTYFLHSPFGTLMALYNYNGSWDGVNYAPYIYLRVATTTPGGNVAITSSVAQRLDSRIDDGSSGTGILHYDNAKLDFFLLGIMP